MLRRGLCAELSDSMTWHQPDWSPNTRVTWHQPDWSPNTQCTCSGFLVKSTHTHGYTHTWTHTHDGGGLASRPKRPVKRLTSPFYWRWLRPPLL